MNRDELMAFGLVSGSKMHIEVGWRKERGWKMSVAACGRTGTPLDFSRVALAEVSEVRLCKQCLGGLSKWGVV